jgi:hypothetical protein
MDNILKAHQLPFIHKTNSAIKEDILEYGRMLDWLKRESREEAQPPRL